MVGGTIEDAIAKPLAASTRDLATTTVGNILLVQELSLVDQTSWSPNWAVDELQEQALTVAESEELLRTKYRFDAGPNPPDMLVLCIECPRDEIIAAQSSKPVTVRELVLELLRRSRRKIYDLAPLEQPNVVQISLGTLAPDGYYRFSVGVVSSAR